MNTPSTIFRPASAAAACAIFLLLSPLAAQRGGRGGGIRPIVAPESRLVSLEKSFELTKDQKNQIKALMDAAHKNAAPIRDGLLKAHEAMGAAVQGGKAQPEIDAAARAYAEQAAAMAALEMKALADIVKTLTDTQRSNNAAISAAFFNMRGAFLDNRRWDEVPESRVRY